MLGSMRQLALLPTALRAYAFNWLLLEDLYILRFVSRACCLFVHHHLSSANTCLRLTLDKSDWRLPDAALPPDFLDRISGHLVELRQLDPFLDLSRPSGPPLLSLLTRNARHLRRIEDPSCSFLHVLRTHCFPALQILKPNAALADPDFATSEAAAQALTSRQSLSLHLSWRNTVQALPKLDCLRELHLMDYSGHMTLPTMSPPLRLSTFVLLQLSGSAQVNREMILTLWLTLPAFCETSCLQVLDLAPLADYRGVYDSRMHLSSKLGPMLPPPPPWSLPALRELKLGAWITVAMFQDSLFFPHVMPSVTSLACYWQCLTPEQSSAFTLDVRFPSLSSLRLFSYLGANVPAFPLIPCSLRELECPRADNERICARMRESPVNSLTKLSLHLLFPAPIDMLIMCPQLRSPEVTFKLPHGFPPAIELLRKSGAPSSSSSAPCDPLFPDLCTLRLKLERSATAYLEPWSVWLALAAPRLESLTLSVDDDSFADARCLGPLFAHLRHLCLLSFPLTHVHWPVAPRLQRFVCAIPDFSDPVSSGYQIKGVLSWLAQQPLVTDLELTTDAYIGDIASLVPTTLRSLCIGSCNHHEAREALQLMCSRLPSLRYLQLPPSLVPIASSTFHTCGRWDVHCSSS